MPAIVGVRMIQRFCQFIVLLGFLFVVALPFFLEFDQDGRLKRNQVRTNVNAAAGAMEQSAKTLRADLPNYVKPFKNSPDMQAFRAEVAAAPEKVPESLADFAKEVAEEMVKAKHSLAAATALFSRLTQCATAGAEVEHLTVRAVCAQNASVLADLYPENLSADFKRFVRNLDAQVRQMIY